MKPDIKSRDQWDGLERLLYDYSLPELLEAAESRPSRLLMAELQLRFSLGIPMETQEEPAVDKFNSSDECLDINPSIYLG